PGRPGSARSAATTDAPRSSSSSATARPIPPAAPVTVARFPANVIRPRAAPQPVDGDGDDQQQAAHDVLPERLDVEQHDAVVDDADHEHAQDRADDRAAPAGEAGSAEDDGGDRRELEPGRGVA